MKSTSFFTPGQVSSYESGAFVEQGEGRDAKTRQCVEGVLLCGSDWNVGTTLMLQLACRMGMMEEAEDGVVWIVTTRCVSMECRML